MKAKLYLTLLALNGLIFSANSLAIAAESHPNSRSNINPLSQTIAKLVDIEDRTNLVQLAIDRALLAQQQVNHPQLTPPVTAGVPRLDVIHNNKDTPQPSQTESKIPQNDNKANRISGRKERPKTEANHKNIDRDNESKVTIDRVKTQMQLPPIGRYLKDRPNGETNFQNTDRSTSK